MTFAFPHFLGCVFTGGGYSQGPVGCVGCFYLCFTHSLSLSLSLSLFNIVFFSVGLHYSSTYESVATWPTYMTQVSLLYSSFCVGVAGSITGLPLALFTVKKSSLLKHGRIDIVQCLRDLPKTKHISHTFNVDVFKATVSYGFALDILVDAVVGVCLTYCIS